jgi:sarcosine oxidase
MTKTDVIVIGAGGMGSSLTAELAHRGYRVRAFEQFSPVHDQGSSHGHSRIIREAYYEHPSYVPLVRRSFVLWRELEQRTGQRLLLDSPCLNIGTPESEVVRGVLSSAREHHLPIETLHSKQLSGRFPQFQFGEEYVGILEQRAGILSVEECVRSYLNVAANSGAEIHAPEPVLSWSANDTGCTVTTSKGNYHSRYLALTAGAWMGAVMAHWGQPLRLMRQTMHWYEGNESFAAGRLPVFLADTPEGYFYGVPYVDSQGVKVAQHYGAPEVGSPLGIDRAIISEDRVAIDQFVQDHLPGMGPWRSAQACIYTLTPDRHFLLGRHPDHANVVLAGGFSGHGFKFAPVVGEILADLIQKGVTDWPIELFQPNRFRSES